MTHGVFPTLVVSLEPLQTSGVECPYQRRRWLARVRLLERPQDSLTLNQTGPSAAVSEPLAIARSRVMTCSGKKAICTLFRARKRRASTHAVRLLSSVKDDCAPRNRHKLRPKAGSSAKASRKPLGPPCSASWQSWMASASSLSVRTGSAIRATSIGRHAQDIPVLAHDLFRQCQLGLERGISRRDPEAVGRFGHMQLVTYPGAQLGEQFRGQELPRQSCRSF